MAEKNADQPAPTVRPDLTASWEEVVSDFEIRYSAQTHPYSRVVIDSVLRDMRERDQIGRARYGTPLTAHNGRDQLVDAYQELLDASVYLRSAIDEGVAGLLGTYKTTLDSIASLRQTICDRVPK